MWVVVIKTDFLNMVLGKVFVILVYNDIDIYYSHFPPSPLKKY